jgi:hypothetical protein
MFSNTPCLVFAELVGTAVGFYLKELPDPTILKGFTRQLFADFPGFQKPEIRKVSRPEKSCTFTVLARLPHRISTPGIERRLLHAFKVLVLTVFRTPPRRHLLLSKTSYLVHNFFTTRCQTVLEVSNLRRTLWVTDLLFACWLRSSQLACSPVLAFIPTTLESLRAWRRAAML